MRKYPFLAIVLPLLMFVFFACASANKGSPTPASTDRGPDETVELTVGGVALVSLEDVPIVPEGEPDIPAAVGTLSMRVPARVRAGDEARGRIVIYTSMYETVFDDVEAAMERHFPDCDVVFVYGGTGLIQARIGAEIAAGKLGCDILMVAEPSYSIELKERGLLHPYKSPEAPFLAFDYDPEGYWHPVRVSNMVLAYNPERYVMDQVPQSYYEFAYDRTVTGRTSMGDPHTSGTAMVTINALWDRYSYRYFDALGSRTRVNIESGADAMTMLENGQRMVAMILEENILRKRQEEGSKLEVIYPYDGTVVIPSTIVIINDDWNASKNIPSAEAITDWFLSEEGQNVIVSGWMHSVREGFGRFPYDSIPTGQITANTMPVIWENVFRHRAEIQRSFEQRVMRRR